ncbi:MAG TPA: DUF4880 domain-containing protein [Rhizomicrobium sp.]|nr:DUF4880 domain-containing protein [Rhizomicrobium sp.]
MTDASIETEAAAWVARFDAGDVSAQDQAAFRAWLCRDARHRQAFEAHANLWSRFDVLRHLTESEPGQS